MLTSLYQSPVGNLLLGVTGNSVCLCDWVRDDRVEKTLRRICRYAYPEDEDNAALLTQASSQLDEYFAGIREEFDLPLIFHGTEFQKKVWHSLCEIPYAKTATYKEIAQNLGIPASVRAVANAIGANPVSIFVPCHRVIGSNGTLTGYAGGLVVKERLLHLERLTFDPADLTLFIPPAGLPN